MRSNTVNSATFHICVPINDNTGQKYAAKNHRAWAKNEVTTLEIFSDTDSRRQAPNKNGSRSVLGLDCEDLHMYHNEYSALLGRDLEFAIWKETTCELV